MSGIVATNEAFSIIGRRLGTCSSATALALLQLGLVESFDDETVRFLPELGIEVKESDVGLVVAVHLHAKGHEGFGQFPFDFKGLTFSSRRSEVLEALGEPLDTGIGAQGPWDKYATSDKTIHFLFGGINEQILMVSVELAACQ